MVLIDRSRIITFANVVGRMLCIHPCLSVCLFVTLRNSKSFRKVYWSVAFVCLFVCLSFCLSSSTHSSAPIKFIFSQPLHLVHRTEQHKFCQNRTSGFFFVAMETNRSMMRDRDFSIFWYFISQLLVEISL